MTSRHALVIGAGLAGAAAASALARQGWRVQVIDAAPEPACGASALPAGLMAPHLSADDGLLSRLTRAGLQATRAELERLSAGGRLRPGMDWQGTGALEHRLRSAKPPALPEAASGGSRPATAQELAAAALPAEARAVWHPQAGWVKPGALVRAWLAEPGVTWRGGLQVERLVRVDTGEATHALATSAGGSPDSAEPARAGATPAAGASSWQALDGQGQLLAQAPLVVVAAALGSAALLEGLGRRPRLQPVRGQVSWGLAQAGDVLPPFPVNGNGHLLTGVPLAGGLAWLSGSSYGHGETATEARAADHAANLDRIRALLPATGACLAPAFAGGRVRAWTGVRCASTDRRPLVGPLAPGLWALTALGSRGLTLSALCARLLASRIVGAPLPVPEDLAAALDLARQGGGPYPA